jgi:acetyl esterase
MLDIPATDLTMSHPSVEEFGDGYMLTKREMDNYVDSYLPDPKTKTNPYASPLFAEDLSGLPPAQVTTAEYDPLRDEGKAYADRLRAAGVPVDYICMPGHVHGSFAMTQLLPSAREYHRTCVAALRKAR